MVPVGALIIRTDTPFRDEVGFLRQPAVTVIPVKIVRVTGDTVIRPHAEGAVRPQLTRRAEAMKAVQQQAQAREEVEDAVEVRLSKDEQLQQRRANQRLGAEVMSQRIREMSDNDPRVVALVIRQWINNDHE